MTLWMMTGFCGLGKMFRRPQITPNLACQMEEKSWFNKTHNGFVLPKGLNGQCLFQSLSRLWESTCHHPNLQHEGLVWCGESTRFKAQVLKICWEFLENWSYWKFGPLPIIRFPQDLDWFEIRREFCQETTAKLDHITGLSGSYSKPRSLTQQLWEWQEKQPSPSKVKYLEPRNVFIFVNALMCMCPDLHRTQQNPASLPLARTSCACCSWFKLA